MAEQVVCCPYCVQGDNFMPMLPRTGGWFICVECGDTAIPKKTRVQMLLSEVRRVEPGSVFTTTRKAAQACRAEQK